MNIGTIPPIHTMHREITSSRHQYTIGYYCIRVFTILFVRFRGDGVPLLVACNMKAMSAWCIYTNGRFVRRWLRRQLWCCWWCGGWLLLSTTIDGAVVMLEPYNDSRQIGQHSLSWLLWFCFGFRFIAIVVWPLRMVLRCMSDVKANLSSITCSSYRLKRDFQQNTSPGVMVYGNE
jgi:hypothetical protein